MAVLLYTYSMISTCMGSFAACCVLYSVAICTSGADLNACSKIGQFTKPPAEFNKDSGKYKSPLMFEDGHAVTTTAGWQVRRKEILKFWESALGSWPGLIGKPKLERLDSKARENLIQHRVRLEIAHNQSGEGYLLIPTNAGRVPAVLVPFYEPETSIGLGKSNLDFGYALAKRGFVTLSIGSPGGDARKPPTNGMPLQPLSFLAYVAANCCNALAGLKEVDADRIGIVGHSYGGKWAMFASCLYEKFACAVWCDPGIVFDESRPNVNYWEPWYLGLEVGRTRKPGVPIANNPRTGPYELLCTSGHDLHELHALMAPRPFLVSGGSEDPPERWRALNHAVAVNTLLGHSNRVAMTNRPMHTPTAESNQQIFDFFECWLKGRQD